MSGCCEQYIECCKPYFECYEPHIECPEHGRQQVAYVCQHIAHSLVDSKPMGFWSAEPNIENVRPDAWCSTCEEMISPTGEWSDESEAIAGVQLLCGVCYDRAKQMNQNSNKK